MVEMITALEIILEIFEDEGKQSKEGILIS